MRSPWKPKQRSTGAEPSSGEVIRGLSLGVALGRRASRLLDQGEIDGDLADRGAALQALHGFLATFALRGRNEAKGYWWGRRSADADLEVQVVLRRTVDAGEDACPILISTLTNPQEGRMTSEERSLLGKAATDPRGQRRAMCETRPRTS